MNVAPKIGSGPKPPDSWKVPAYGPVAVPVASYDPPVEQSNVPVKPEPLTLKLSPVSVGTAAAVAGKATTNPRATLRPRPIKLRRFHRRIISTLLFQRFRAPEGSRVPNLPGQERTLLR